MVKIGQIRRCGRLEKFVVQAVAMCNPTQVFLINSLSKNVSFVSEQDLALSQNHKLSITVLTIIHWVKPAWPIKPILLISRLVFIA